jgi:hypothetical protein
VWKNKTTKIKLVALWLLPGGTLLVIAYLIYLWKKNKGEYYE